MVAERRAPYEPGEPIRLAPVPALTAIDGLMETDAEIWLMGSLLDQTSEELLTPALARARQGEMLTTVPTDAFLRQSFRVMWGIGRELWREGHLISAPNVWLRVEQLGLAKNPTLFPQGFQELERLMLDNPTPVGWQYFAERVTQAHRRRQAVSLLQVAQQRLLDREDDPETIISSHIAALAGLTTDANGRRLRSLGAIIDADAETFRYRLENPLSFSGLTIGLDCVDYVTDGFRAGEIITVAAQTSGGKSIFALQTGLRLTAGTGGRAPLPVFYLSVEMIGESLKDRAVHAQAGIDPRLGKLQRAWRPDQKAALLAATDDLRELPLHIEDGNGADWYGIQSQIDLAVARFGIGFVVIDHLHLCHIKGWKQNRTEELNAIMAGIKGLATKYKIPVMVLVQLNRGDNDGGAFVDMSRIKGSGDIEQAADVVMFLERPAQGKKPQPLPCIHDPWRADQPAYCDPQLHELKLHFVKVRNGQVCSRNAWIDLPTSRITDPAQEWR